MANPNPANPTLKAWTVGELRAALDGVPDDLPLVCWVAEEPNGDTVQDQFVYDASYADIDWGDGNGLHEDRARFGLSCEFLPDIYTPPRPGDPALIKYEE